MNGELIVQIGRNKYSQMSIRNILIKTVASIVNISATQGNCQTLSGIQVCMAVQAVEVRYLNIDKVG